MPGAQPPTEAELKQAWHFTKPITSASMVKPARFIQASWQGLQGLAALGLPMACLTNKPRDLAQKLLQQKGLSEFFQVVFGGDSFERKKPDPLPLIKTCEFLGFEPSQVLMIGDSSNDAQAAHAAGCKLALLSHGYNHGQPIREVPANLHLDSLAEILL
jgi:phosphoglycolate phosphatase